MLRVGGVGRSRHLTLLRRAGVVGLALGGGAGTVQALLHLGVLAAPAFRTLDGGRAGEPAPGGILNAAPVSGAAGPGAAGGS